jgi:hypothetical protein
MHNEWSGYTFDAAGPPSVTAKAAAPAGGAVDAFLLAYDGFDPGTEGLREALTSTGNGYLYARRGGVGGRRRRALSGYLRARRLQP